MVSNENVRVNNSGIGFSGLLAIVFITLKLTGYIDWSWVWVLAPLWIPVVIIFVILLIMFSLGARVRSRRMK